MASKSTTSKTPAASFKINSYKTFHDSGLTHLIIEGQKLPPPSKRITLRQKNIKVLDASIIFKHKKGDIAYEVIRVNRIKSFGEVRLHTSNILYPGKYEISLSFSGELNENILKSNGA